MTNRISYSTVYLVVTALPYRLEFSLSLRIKDQSYIKYGVLEVWFNAFEFALRRRSLQLFSVTRCVHPCSR